MDVDAKKTTLRMIRYSLYGLRMDDGKGTVGAANGYAPSDGGGRRQDFGCNVFYGG